MESLPQKTPGSWGPGQSKSDHKFFGSQNSAAPGILEFWRPNTPKETNSGISHWKIGRITKRTRILSSNHIFSGVNLLLVSGRVSISTFNAPLLTTYIPENSRISPLKKKWLVQMYFLLKNSPLFGGTHEFSGVFLLPKCFVMNPLMRITEDEILGPHRSSFHGVITSPTQTRHGFCREIP